MAMNGVDYPVRFEADYPESPSRLLALLGVIFWIKGLLLIPHIIVLFFIGIASFIAVYIGYWAVLITGSYPMGLFNFVAGVQRWSTRTDSWMNGVADRYPPFTLGESDYPARFEVDYPELSSRGLAVLGVIFFIKWILLLPPPDHPLLPIHGGGGGRLHKLLGGRDHRPISEGAVQLRNRRPTMDVPDKRMGVRLDGPLSALQPELARIPSPRGRRGPDSAPCERERESPRTGLAAATGARTSLP